MPSVPRRNVSTATFLGSGPLSHSHGHIGVDVEPGAVGQKMLAARISLMIDPATGTVRLKDMAQSQRMAPQAEQVPVS